jgi:ribosomal protein L29
VTERHARKKAELTAKLDALRAELAHWRAASQTPPLDKHHSQIKAVTRSLRLRMETLTPDADSWPQTERTLLRVHEVWGYFRQKFALRYVNEFLGFLRLADEFTWACYRPAQQLGSGPHNVPYDEVREPPLTFFDQVSSPVAIPRGTSYAKELHSTVLADDELTEVVRRLPVPVIGIPWFQLRHLPDALVLGHEVGHHVETDFRLTETLRQVTQADQDPWHSWLSEIFADVYGTLATGPAFARALADFIPTGKLAQHGNAEYPPAELRIRVVAETLTCCGFAAEAEALLTDWNADFPPTAQPHRTAEATMIARAICESTYPQFGGVPLTEVLTFRPFQENTETAARSLLLRQEFEPGLEIRALLAGAGLAFYRNPQYYLDENLTDKVLAHAHTIELKGLRATQPAPAANRDDKAAQAIADIL